MEAGGGPGLPEVLIPDQHAGAIYDTLMAAMVNDPNQPGARKEAEQVLASCEGLYGYCDVLCHLFASHGVNEDARLMALLCLQNTIKRHWRPNRQQIRSSVGPLRTIAEDEKARLRVLLLSHMQETHPLLAKNLAHVLARVVRLDWPKEWPDFFPSLLAILSQGPPLQTLRATYSLHGVVKALASKVLMADKRAFRDMAQLLFPIAYKDLWRPRMAELLAALSSSASQLDQVVSMAHVAKTCTKIVYFLVSSHVDVLDAELVAGFFNDHHASIGPILRAHKGLIGQRQQSGGQAASESLLHGLSKLLKHLALVMVDAQKKSPLAVRAFLSAYLHLFYDELEAAAATSGPEASMLLLSSSDPADPCRHFYLQAATFLSNCVSCAEYTPQASNGGSSRTISFAGEADGQAEWTREASESISAFFSPERCMRLCDLMVQRLLGLWPEDLDLWLANPEDLLLEEEQRRPEDDMRAAAEHLFLTLWDARRSLIAVNLMALAKNAAAQVAAASSPDATQEVLFMDRVYLAMGLVSFSLSEHLDLTEWFSTVFQPVAAALLAPPQPRRPPVLLRRLAYLVACMGSAMPSPVKPAICQFLASIVDPSNPATDLIVALQAMEVREEQKMDVPFRFIIVARFWEAMHNLVNDWDFVRQEPNLPALLGPCLGHVYGVLSASSELTNKKKVFDFLNDLIEALGPASAPYASLVVTPLQSIWEASSSSSASATPPATAAAPPPSSSSSEGGLSDLRACILAVLKVLLPKLGSSSQASLHPLILPFIDVATDPDREDHIALLEDGLALWQVAVRYAESYEESGLGLLVPRLPVILDRGLEHLRVVMILLEDYTLLGGQAFLSRHMGVLCTCLKQTAAKVVERGAAYVTRTMEVLLVAFPAEGADALVQSGVLTQLLQSCMLSSAKAPAAESDVVIVQHLTILSRVILTSPAAFSKLAAGNHLHVLQLVDMMLQMFDQVAASASGCWRRKLWCLALTSLLSGSLGDCNVVVGVLERVDQVINICVDVMAEEAMEGGDKGGEDRKLVKTRLTGSRDDYDLLLLVDLDEGDTLTGDSTARLEPYYQRDMVNQTDLATFLRTSLEACSVAVGPELVKAALGAVDPVIMQQLGAI